MGVSNEVTVCFTYSVFYDSSEVSELVTVHIQILFSVVCTSDGKKSSNTHHKNDCGIFTYDSLFCISSIHHIRQFWWFLQKFKVNQILAYFSVFYCDSITTQSDAVLHSKTHVFHKYEIFLLSTTECRISTNWNFNYKEILNLFET